MGSGDRVNVGRIYQMSSWPSILFFSKIIHLFLFCVSKCFAGMYMYVCGALRNQGVRFGSEVIGGCELPRGC